MTEQLEQTWTIYVCGECGFVEANGAPSPESFCGGCGQAKPRRVEVVPVGDRAIAAGFAGQQTVRGSTGRKP